MKKRKSPNEQFVTVLPLARRGYYHVNLTVGNEAFQVSIGGHKKKEARWLKGQVIKMLDKIVDEELKKRKAGAEFWRGVREGLADAD